MAHDADSHISIPRIRPRFKVRSKKRSEEIVTTIRKHLKSESPTCAGKTTAHFATIYPLAEDQHYWSPQLTITIEEEEHGSLVRGLYGPKPSVWTMFVFFYSFIGFAILIVLMIGLSFLTLDQPATILWLVPILVFIFLSLYLVAYTGQKLGHKQMSGLHRFIEKCLEREITLS